jgi:hypothetical protein
MDVDVAVDEQDADAKQSQAKSSYKAANVFNFQKYFGGKRASLTPGVGVTSTKPAKPPKGVKQLADAAARKAGLTPETAIDIAQDSTNAPAKSGLAKSRKFPASRAASASANRTSLSDGEQEDGIEMVDLSSSECDEEDKAQEADVTIVVGKSVVVIKKKTVSSKLAFVRQAEHCEEGYIITALNKLKCSYCDEFLLSDSTTCTRHNDSIKHTTNKALKVVQAAQSKHMVAMMRSYLEKNSAAGGELVSDDKMAFRLDILKIFIQQGVAINKIDAFRPVLEKHSTSTLTGSSHLRLYIPALLAEEKRIIRESMCGQYVSIIFDGTTTVAEIFCIVMRWVDNSFVIHQKCAHVGCGAVQVLIRPQAVGSRHCQCVSRV